MGCGIIYFIFHCIYIYIFLYDILHIMFLIQGKRSRSSGLDSALCSGFSWPPR